MVNQMGKTILSVGQFAAAWPNETPEFLQPFITDRFLTWEHGG